MNLKVTLILVVVAVLLCGGLFLVMKKQSQPDAGRNTGIKVFPDLPVNDIAKLVMRDSKTTVTLERKGGEWVVADYYDYPAQFTMVSDSLKKLYDMTIGQVVRVRPESLGRLQLEHPDNTAAPDDQKGTLVAAFLEDGQTVATCIVGKDKMKDVDESNPYQFMAQKDGQYVCIPGENKVYLVNQVLNLEKQPLNWIDRRIFSVTKDQISELTVTLPAGETYTISHTNATEPFILADMSADQQLKSSDVDSLATSLGYFTISSVVDPSIAATTIVMNSTWTITGKTFDGTVYTVSLSETNSPVAYMQVGVEFQQPDFGLTVTNEKQRVVLEEKGYEIQDKAKLLNNKISPWLYTIPDYKANQMRKSLESLLEPVKKEEAEPAAETSEKTMPDPDEIE